LAAPREPRRKRSRGPW